MATVYEDTSRVKDLVANAPHEALRVAMAIEPPAARIYALAWIIQHANGDVVRQAINEARTTARACGDAYGRATALADPIRAAFERGEVGSAHRMMDEALAHLPKMPTISEQAETLRLLFDAAQAGDNEVWSMLVGQLVDRCPAHTHWRAARAHLRAIAALKERDPGLADRLVAALSPGPIARRARRLLEQ